MGKGLRMPPLLCSCWQLLAAGEGERQCSLTVWPWEGDHAPAEDFRVRVFPELAAHILLKDSKRKRNEAKLGEQEVRVDGEYDQNTSHETI